MDTLVKRLKESDVRQRASLLSNVRVLVSEEECIDPDLFPDILRAIGVYVTSDDLNLRKQAILALVVMLAACKQNVAEYEKIAHLFPNLMSGIYKLWGSVSSKEEANAGLAAMQLIYDMSDVVNLVSNITSGLTHSKPNVQMYTLQGIVEATERLQSEFAEPLASDATITLLINLMDANSGIVRDAVPAALGALYRYNSEIRTRVNNSKLRRDPLNALKKLFDTADEEGDVLSRTTAAYDQSLVIQSSLVASSSSSSLASSSSSITRSTSSTNIASGVVGRSVGSEEELKKEMASIAKELKDADKRANDWQKHVAQLKRFQGLIVGGATEWSNFLECLSPAFVTIFKQLLPMSRAQISDETTKALSVLSSFAGHHVASFCEKIMKTLLDKLHATNGIIVEHSAVCIGRLLREVRPNVGALIADLTIKDLHNSTRQRCIQFIYQLITEGSNEYIDKYAEVFQAAVKAALNDSDSETRTLARNTFAAFHKRWPTRGLIVWDGLDSAIRSALEKAGKAPADSRAPSPDSIFNGSGFGGGVGVGGVGGSAHSSSAPKLNLSTSSVPQPLHSSPVQLNELSSSAAVVTVPNSHSSSVLAKNTTKQSSGAAPSVSVGPKREKVTSHERLPSASRGTGPTSSNPSNSLSAPASRIASSKPPLSNGQRTTALGATAKAPQRVVDSSQTPRKQVSTSVLAKPVAVQAPSSISKSTSAGGLGLGLPHHAATNTLTKSKAEPSKPAPKKVEKNLISDTASDTSVESNKSSKDETSSSSAPSSLFNYSKPIYSGSSTDTSEFRNIHKRCSMTETEERVKAFESLRQLLKTDELPGLWKQLDLVKATLALTLAKGLVDAQVRANHASLEMLYLMISEHPDVAEGCLDLISASLFQACWSPSLRDDQKVAQELVVNLANLSPVSSSSLIKAAMKALEVNDIKIRSATVRSISLFISSATSYFEKQPKRTEQFIKFLAVKPNVINSSVDMTRAVTEVFGQLYAMLGEGFAVPLRSVKFVGLDTVLKRLKIPLVAPKISSSSLAFAAQKPTVTKKTNSVGLLSSNNASATNKTGVGAKSSVAAKSTSIVKPLGAKPVASNNGATSTHATNAGAKTVKPRPVLTKQKSLSNITTTRERLPMATLEEAKVDLARGALPTGSSAVKSPREESTNDSEQPQEMDRPTGMMDELVRLAPSKVAQTPSAERTREMRAEIQQTPNVLATVMGHSYTVSPLTPSLRNATPSFGARGRSTSTPQLRSFKVAGREVDTETLNAETGEPNETTPGGGDLFSPVKFRLDASSDAPDQMIPPPKPSSPLAGTLKELEAIFAVLSVSSTNAEWEPGWTLISNVREQIRNLSTDALLLSLNEERLMAIMARCLERAQAPTKVRQRACEIISAIRPRIPECDWNVHFATLSEAQRKLVTGFMSSMQRGTTNPSSSNTTISTTAATISSSSSSSQTELHTPTPGPVEPPMAKPEASTAC